MKPIRIETKTIATIEKRFLVSWIETAELRSQKGRCAANEYGLFIAVRPSTSSRRLNPCLIGRQLPKPSRTDKFRLAACCFDEKTGSSDSSNWPLSSGLLNGTASKSIRIGQTRWNPFGLSIAKSLVLNTHTHKLRPFAVFDNKAWKWKICLQFVYN